MLNKVQINQLRKQLNLQHEDYMDKHVAYLNNRDQALQVLEMAENMAELLETGKVAARG